MSFLKNLFGSKPKADFAQLKKDGALIIDVRTPAEFAGGHIHNAKNIPVDKVVEGLRTLKDKNTPIITCCASGMRSGAAKNLLLANGFTNVHNGGSWQSLREKLR